MQMRIMNRMHKSLAGWIVDDVTIRRRHFDVSVSGRPGTQPDSFAEDRIDFTSLDDESPAFLPKTTCREGQPAFRGAQGP